MEKMIEKIKLLELFVDEDGSSLTFLSDKESSLIDSKGDVHFKEQEGILVHKSVSFLSDEMESEKNERDKQSEKYDKRLNKRLHKEILPTQKIINKLASGTVIEYGCGTGRFTTFLAKKSELVIAIDFSYRSLEILRDKLDERGIKNVILIQADVTEVYFKECSINAAFSFQVYEHIPNLWQRQQWLVTINRALVDGGKVYMSLYHQDILRSFKKQSAVGFHDGRIYYRFYNASLLRSEWYGIFGDIKIDYLDLRIPGEVRLRLPERMAGAISTIGSRVFLLRKLAHLVTVTTVKSNNSILLNNSIGYLYPAKLRPQYISWFGDYRIAPSISQSHFSYSDGLNNKSKIKSGLTSIIDLSKPEDELWSNCRKKFIRTQIKRGERNGIVVKQIYDHNDLTALYNQFRKSKSLPPSSPSVLVNGTLYGAYYDNKLIAGGIFLSNQKVARAYALISARLTDKEVRELIGQANRMVIWRAIMDLKDKGLSELDLGGLNLSEGDNLSEFKEAFGGKRCDQHYYINNVPFSVRQFVFMWLRRVKDLI